MGSFQDIQRILHQQPQAKETSEPVGTEIPVAPNDPYTPPVVEEREDRFGNVESLVPYCRLIQYREGREHVVGNTRSALRGTGYGRSEIMGLQDVEMKYGMGFITVDVSFPIHQDIISTAELERDSEMGKLFDLSNRWRIEFGWGNAPNGGFKIDEMMLADWSLDYDQELRSFIGKFKLVPKHNFILGDIKVFMLTDEIREINNAITNGLSNELSVGAVISKILDGCKRVVAKDGGISEISLMPNNSQTGVPFTTPEERRASEEKRREDERAWYKKPWFKVSGWFGGKEGSRDEQVALVSSTFILAEPDDIPEPDDIRLMLFGDKGIDSIALASAFKNEGMQLDTTLQKLTDDKNSDMNVHQFITSLLKDNGFTWMPSFASLNKSGKLQWIILQSDFNNMDDHIQEVEIVGIRPTPQNQPDNTVATKHKFINTWGEKNTTTSQLFDVHSKRNVVISVNASTDPGHTTIASIKATQAIASSNNSVPAGDLLEANKNRMYAYLAQQAKELNIETLGFPEIKIGDNIYVNLAGELYSGKYKIIEMDHKISDTFTTNLRAIRTVSGISPKPDSNDQPGKTELTTFEKTRRDNEEFKRRNSGWLGTKNR